MIKSCTFMTLLIISIIYNYIFIEIIEIIHFIIVEIIEIIINKSIISII